MLRLLVLLLFPACSAEPPVAQAAVSDPVAAGGIALAPSADLVGISLELEEGPEPAAPAAPAPPPPVAAAVAAPPADPGLGVEGGRALSYEQIKGTVEGNLAKVRACYERELKSTPELAGKLVLAWTVGADGVVRNVETVQDGLRNRDASSCIRRSVAGWRFPRAESPSDVEYPFVLRPSF